MPSVSYDSLGFRLNGRRIAIAAAGFDAVLVDPDGWAPRLAALRGMGFNAVAVRVPWSLHEPLEGRVDLAGSRDIGRFLREAAEAGLHAIVRIGPVVGGSFAAGGLPGWVGEIEGIRLREADPAFVDRVSAFWRRLLPEIVPLQATEEGPASAPRPVLAVGIEHDWRSVDAAVGEAYFGALVRIAREQGVRVPLLTANNCWTMHEAAIECWRQSDGVHRNLVELAAVEPDAPRVALIEPADPAAGGPIARTIAAAVAARADFVLEDAVSASHGGATSADGLAEIVGSVLDASGAPRVSARPMRRVLATATSLGQALAGCEAPALESLGDDPERTVAPLACTLDGADGLRISVAFAPASPRRGRARTGASATLAHRCSDGASHAMEIGSAAGVEFFASGIDVGRIRVERSSAAIVAVVGDRLLAVSGRARSRIRLRISGSEFEQTVPTDAGAPKVVKARGATLVVVPHALADGVSWSETGVSFEAPDGTVHAVALDGRQSRTPASAAPRRPRAVRLGDPETIRLDGICEGRDPRFAPVAAPRPLGAWGVAEGIGVHRATWRDRGRRKAARRRLAFMHATSTGGAELRVSVDGAPLRPLDPPIVEVASSGSHAIIAVACDLGAPHAAAGRPRGVFGPLVEVAPLTGVKVVDAVVPTFDATRVGAFVHGYDARGGAQTLLWTFAPRTKPVLVDLGATRARGVLRLNGEIVATSHADDGQRLVLLPAERLGGRRPATAGRRGAKAAPASGKPLPNELLLDIEDGVADARMLARIRKECTLLSVEGEVACDWAFARLLPPATWVGAVPAEAGKVAAPGDGRPAWFRRRFTLDAPRTLELTMWPAFAGIAYLNGVPVLRGDRASGDSTGRSRTRSSTIAAGLARAGVNELVVLSYDGWLSHLELR